MLVPRETVLQLLSPMNQQTPRHEPDLFDAMVEDAAVAGPLWSPTAYWRPYCDRIQREIARSGLAAFRTNQRLLKGFAMGGVTVPSEPMAAWKRAIWRGAAKLPIVQKIIAEHERLTLAEHKFGVRASINLARLVLDRIGQQFPAMTPPDGVTNGGAEDAFSWRGHNLSAAWVQYLASAADFYTAVPPERVTSILEIGPGLGLSTLAHLALNPNLKLIINCDIVPVLYISTQFLKTIRGIDVIDYSSLRHRKEIEPTIGPKPRVYQIPPWQLPMVKGTVDVFFNAASFQEMEQDVVKNYAALVTQLATHGVALYGVPGESVPIRPAKNSPITLASLRQLFAPTFPMQVAPGSISQAYETTSAERTLILVRSEAKAADFQATTLR